MDISLPIYNSTAFSLHHASGLFGPPLFGQIFDWVVTIQPESYILEIRLYSARASIR